MATLEARGLDGSTLLGFLASVGSLRLVSEKNSRARLRFDPADDHAIFEVEEFSTDEIMSAIISGHQAKARDQELSMLGDAPKPRDLPIAALHQIARAARDHDAFAATAAGLICDDGVREFATETTLCAANGAGWQNMFTTMRDLRRLATEQHVRRSLTDSWQFQDEVFTELRKKSKNDPQGWSMGDRKPTLRWDEGSERLYALRLHKPTDDPEPFRTEFAAYALAMAALPCFPVVPTARGGATVFTTRDSSTRTSFWWALWTPPASLTTIKAMHASGEPRTDPASARRRGVYRLLRAQRMILDNGKLVFSPAEGVW
jgi:hypothetical protein